MPKIKAAASGFDGVKSYGAGEVVETSLDHARMAVLLAGAELLDDDGKKITPDEAAKRLRVSEKEIVRAWATHAKTRLKKKGT